MSRAHVRGMLGLFLLFGAVTGCLVPHRAAASTLNVYNGGPAPGLDIDLFVSIAGSKAYFSLTNNSTGAADDSRVHEIYFEDGLSSLLTSPFTANDTGTVSASLLGPNAHPAQPQGAIDPAWSGNLLGVAFDEQNAPKSDKAIKGIRVGGTWVVSFTLVDAATTVDQLLAAVFNPAGHSRIGLHIGECSTGNSCWATILPEPGPSSDIGSVPLPGAFVLMATVLAGAGGIANWRRRRSRAVN